MYNYGAARALLARSEGEATAILNQAGLDVGWIDCPLTTAELSGHPACLATMGTGDFVVKILSGRAAEGFSSEREILGRALECRSGQVGCSAYIFYRDLPELAVDAGVSESQLLGHILAHEIGHLLLGSNSHAAAGVMRAQWGPEDFRTMAESLLIFTEQQARRLREGVSALHTIRADDPDWSPEAFASPAGFKNTSLPVPAH